MFVDLMKCWSRCVFMDIEWHWFGKF